MFFWAIYLCILSQLVPPLASLMIFGGLLGLKQSLA
jgi:hypothetical protein